MFSHFQRSVSSNLMKRAFLMELGLLVSFSRSSFCMHVQRNKKCTVNRFHFLVHLITRKISEHLFVLHIKKKS